MKNNEIVCHELKEHWNKRKCASYKPAERARRIPLTHPNTPSQPFDTEWQTESLHMKLVLNSSQAPTESM